MKGYLYNDKKKRLIKEVEEHLAKPENKGIIASVMKRNLSNPQTSLNTEYKKIEQRILCKIRSQPNNQDWFVETDIKISDKSARAKDYTPDINLICNRKNTFDADFVDDFKKMGGKTKKSGKKTYIIKQGDTLWDIAEDYYGWGSLWPEIEKANPDRVKYHNDVVIILVGDKLNLPEIELPKDTKEWLCFQGPAEDEAKEISCPAFSIKIDPEALKVPFEIPFNQGATLRGTISFDLTLDCQKMGAFKVNTGFSKDSAFLKADIEDFVGGIEVTGKGASLNLGHKFSLFNYDITLGVSSPKGILGPKAGEVSLGVAFEGAIQTPRFVKQLGETTFAGTISANVYAEIFAKKNHSNNNSNNLLFNQDVAFNNLEKILSEYNPSSNDYVYLAAVGSITLALTYATLTGGVGLITFIAATELWEEWKQNKQEFEGGVNL